MIGITREESDLLFEEVFDWCSRPEFQWRYSWGAGDTIIWDNRNAWHSGAGDAPRDQRRIFYRATRSEEHTSELQSLMRNSYAVFCLKKKKTKKYTTTKHK